MTVKTLSDFVADLQSKQVVLDGEADYTLIITAAKEFFGGELPNPTVWKVINVLKKDKTADFIDDL